MWYIVIISTIRVYNIYNVLFSLIRLFVAHSLTPDSFAQALFSEMHKLSASKSGILAKFLQPLLIHHKVPSLILINKVCRARATVDEPQGGSDNPLRFTAGLALSVFMDCRLENVRDLQRIQVQVTISTMFDSVNLKMI